MTATDTPARADRVRTSLPPEFRHDGEVGRGPPASLLKALVAAAAVLGAAALDVIAAEAHSRA